MIEFIPNTDVDSPLNWKIHTVNTNTGLINIKGQTQSPLQWTGFSNIIGGGVNGMDADAPLDAAPVKKYERTNNIGIKDWFFNNVNWLFYDIDRNANYKNPNVNRFMNIISDTNRSAEANLKTEGTIIPKATGEPKGTSNVASNEEPGNFAYMQ
jgi:hypothetical protein